MRKKTQRVLIVAVLVAGVATFWGLGTGWTAGGHVFAAARSGPVRHGKKRLILKDGTYRDVVRLKEKHGRVRYQSEEGGEWREMPASRVDWKATKRWNQEHPHGVTGQEGAFEEISPAQAQREEEQLDNEEHAQREAAKDLMPVVKPGLRLPDENGIFALDEYDGKPELVHLQQADGDLNQDPFHSVQAVDVDRMHGFADVVRMQGVHAAVQMHVGKPVFYVSVRGGAVPAPANAFVVNANVGPERQRGTDKGSVYSRFVIVRVIRQGESRVIFAKQLRDTSQPDVSGNWTLTRKTMLPGGYWRKVTPVNVLEPGEYALVEVLGPKAVNRDVWDFGVNPKAPENQQARLPVH